MYFLLGFVPVKHVFLYVENMICRPGHFCNNTCSSALGLTIQMKTTEGRYGLLGKEEKRQKKQAVKQAERGVRDTRSNTSHLSESPLLSEGGGKERK